MNDLEEIRDGQQQLLHKLDDNDHIAVSDIKNYFIPNWVLSDTQAKNKGTEQHERHEEEAEQVVPDEAWEQIGEEFAAIEWPVLAHDLDNDMVVVGKIDAVHFQDGRPAVVLSHSVTPYSSASSSSSSQAGMAAVVFPPSLSR